MASVRDRTRAKVPQTQCALVDFRKARTPDPRRRSLKAVIISPSRQATSQLCWSLLKTACQTSF